MKAQASIEIFSAILLATIFFITVQAAYQQHAGNASTQIAVLSAKKIATQAANAITLSANAEVNTTINIPAALEEGTAFTLTITNTTASVDWSYGSYLEPLQATSVKNATGAQTFQLSPGTKTISPANNGGVIIG